MLNPAVSYLEHPQDIMRRWLDWRAGGQVALVIVTATEGGSVRTPGAMMAVSEDGMAAGYISGGCVDADVILQAQAAIAAGEPRMLRYGAGSPFADLPLPCGGAIEIAILPEAEAEIVADCQARLAARQPVTLALSTTGRLSFDTDGQSPAHLFRHTPKLRLRIAGRGADCLALARTAEAAGIGVELQLPDSDDAIQAERMGFAPVRRLTTPASLPPSSDDPWTSFMLAFHDTDWEGPLLSQALAGPAFHIGAIGSRRTHERRCAGLADAGHSAFQIERVRGPAGLVPSMRDASMLAVSILAEIVEAYQAKLRTPLRDTALILLAAGQSSRFGGGDKLLASLGGQPVIAHAASALRNEPVAARIAVIGAGQQARADILRLAGWHVVINPDAASGQSTSVRAGLAEAVRNPGVRNAMILLADMPNVPDGHLLALRDALTPEKAAAMSAAGDALLPPAIFSRTAFDALGSLSGDTGARRVFDTLDRTVTVTLKAAHAADIDTADDLAALEGLAHA